MSQSGFGTKLAYENEGEFLDFARIKSVSPSPGEVQDLEFSDNDSTDGWEEAEPGLIKPGETSVQLNYDDDNTYLIYSLLGVVKNYRITLPNGATWTGEGYFKNFGQEYPHDGVISQEATFKWCHKPVYAKANPT